jgi:hypothetical protein
MEAPCSEAMVIVFQTVPIVCNKRKRKRSEKLIEMQEKRCRMEEDDSSVTCAGNMERNHVRNWWKYVGQYRKCSDLVTMKKKSNE